MYEPREVFELSFPASALIELEKRSSDAVDGNISAIDVIIGRIADALVITEAEVSMYHIRHT